MLRIVPVIFLIFPRERAGVKVYGALLELEQEGVARARFHARRTGAENGLAAQVNSGRQVVGNGSQRILDVVFYQQLGPFQVHESLGPHKDKGLVFREGKHKVPVVEGIADRAGRGVKDDVRRRYVVRSNLRLAARKVYAGAAGVFHALQGDGFQKDAVTRCVVDGEPKGAEKVLQGQIYRRSGTLRSGVHGSQPRIEEVEHFRVGIHFHRWDGENHIGLVEQVGGAEKVLGGHVQRGVVIEPAKEMVRAVRGPGIKAPGSVFPHRLARVNQLVVNVIGAFAHPAGLSGEAGEHIQDANPVVLRP